MDTGQAREDDRPSSRHRGGSGGTGSHEEEDEGEVHEGRLPRRGERSVRRMGMRMTKISKIIIIRCMMCVHDFKTTLVR